eukprot:1083373-Pelagomonas_calceolata.AAC.8
MAVRFCPSIPLALHVASMSAGNTAKALHAHAPASFMQQRMHQCISCACIDYEAVSARKEEKERNTIQHARLERPVCFSHSRRVPGVVSMSASDAAMALHSLGRLKFQPPVE